MPERRALIEGLKPGRVADPAQEEAFVFGAEARPSPSRPGAADGNGSGLASPRAGPGLAGAGRVHFTTRIKPELASAIKRISLERQLAGIHPHSLQDLIEEALELWFHKNGPPS